MNFIPSSKLIKFKFPWWDKGTFEVLAHQRILPDKGLALETPVFFLNNALVDLRNEVRQKAMTPAVFDN